MWLIRWGLSALFVIAVPCSAWAQARAIEVEWSAPPECPDAGALEREVLRLLGDTPAGETTRVRASIVRDADVLRLELWTSRGETEGTRTIDGASCEALVEAGALVIAIAIDPEVVLRVAAEAPEPVEPADAGTTDVIEEDSAVAEASAETAASAPAAPSEPIARFVAQAHATIGVGPLPYPSPGGSIALGARISIVELWAGAAFLMEQSTDNARFGLAYGRLRGCLALELGSAVELAPCVAVDVGALWGAGIDIAAARAGTSEWVALTPGLDARLWITDSIGVSIGAELAIPLLARRFTIEVVGRDPMVVFEPAPVGFLGGIGLIVRAP